MSELGEPFYSIAFIASENGVGVVESYLPKIYKDLEDYT